jgi:hypothetical protein
MTRSEGDTAHAFLKIVNKIPLALLEDLSRYVASEVELRHQRGKTTFIRSMLTKDTQDGR